MSRATMEAKANPVQKGLMAITNPKATPPKAEWEIPTPMKAIFLSTTKTDRTPQRPLTTTPAKKAL
jgi:hypothetical protein